MFNWIILDKDDYEKVVEPRTGLTMYREIEKDEFKRISNQFDRKLNNPDDLRQLMETRASMLKEQKRFFLPYAIKELKKLKEDSSDKERIDRIIDCLQDFLEFSEDKEADEGFREVENIKTLETSLEKTESVVKSLPDDELLWEMAGKMIDNIKIRLEEIKK